MTWAAGTTAITFRTRGHGSAARSDPGAGEVPDEPFPFWVHRGGPSAGSAPFGKAQGYVMPTDQAGAELNDA